MLFLRKLPLSNIHLTCLLRRFAFLRLSVACTIADRRGDWMDPSHARPHRGNVTLPNRRCRPKPSPDCATRQTDGTRSSSSRTRPLPPTVLQRRTRAPLPLSASQTLAGSLHYKAISIHRPPNARLPPAWRPASEQSVFACAHRRNACRSLRRHTSDPTRAPSLKSLRKFGIYSRQNHGRHPVLSSMSGICSHSSHGFRPASRGILCICNHSTCAQQFYRQVPFLSPSKMIVCC